MIFIASPEKAISQIIFEIKQIDELFTSFSELLEKSKVEEPTLIELTAIGSILHSFYNGIENIFKEGIETVKYEDTEHYQVTRAVINNPKKMLRELLE